MQICINRKTYIISAFRVCRILNFQYFSRVVDIYGLFSFFSFQLIFHRLLDTSLTNGICRIITVILFFFIFIWRDRTGITDNIGKAFSIIVYPFCILCNLYTLQFIRMFFDHGNGLVRNIFCNGSCYVFLKRILCKSITKYHDFITALCIIILCLLFFLGSCSGKIFCLCFFRIFFLRTIQTDIVLFTEIFYNLIRRCRSFIITKFFVIFQITDFRPSIYICTKAL